MLLFVVGASSFRLLGFPSRVSLRTVPVMTTVAVSGESNFQKLFAFSLAFPSIVVIDGVTGRRIIFIRDLIDSFMMIELQGVGEKSYRLSPFNVNHCHGGALQ